MPTYDYVCEACGHELELFQSMSDKPKRKCPACGALKLYRKIGAGAGVIFKGSGFYETDYRSASYKQGAAADKSQQSKSDAKPDAKSDAASEAKPTKSSDATPSTEKSNGKSAKPDKSDKSDKRTKTD
jgi:putative FmdB family regulatory protein